MEWKERLRLRWDSFGFAIRGIVVLVRSQPNARIHLAIIVSVIAAGVLLQITATEWAILVLCSGWVLSLEAVNTAIEFLADRVSPEFHWLIQNAKDVSAAAVLIAAMTAVLVGNLIFLPRFFSLLAGAQ